MNSKESFSDIKEILEIENYLKHSLDRHNIDSFFLHYTNIEAINNILETGYIWLNDYNQMNDLFEKELLNYYQCDGKLFFMSFSEGEESLAMYKMYCCGKRAAILKIPVKTVIEIITNAYNEEEKGGLDDDGKECSGYIRKTNIVEGDVVTEEQVETRIYCSDLTYYNQDDSSIKYKNEINKHFVSPFEAKELCGMIKYNCWEYEREVRVYGDLIEIPRPIRRIALKLPDDFCKKVQVILGPEFDKELYSGYLFQLRLLGVYFNNSIYDGIFNDKGKQNKISNWNRYLIEDNYLGKRFEGEDPWDGVLNVSITGFKNGELYWTWKNIFYYDENEMEVSKELHTFLDEDFIGHYGLEIRKNVSNDEKEYISYSYSGSIQLVDNLVIISFNSGQVYSYVLGGSGAFGYSESGGCRMGTNLMSILNEKDSII